MSRSSAGKATPPRGLEIGPCRQAREGRSQGRGRQRGQRFVKVSSERPATGERGRRGLPWPRGCSAAFDDVEALGAGDTLDLQSGEVLNRCLTGNWLDEGHHSYHRSLPEAVSSSDFVLPTIAARVSITPWLAEPCFPGRASRYGGLVAPPVGQRSSPVSAWKEIVTEGFSQRDEVRKSRLRV